METHAEHTMRNTPRYRERQNIVNVQRSNTEGNGQGTKTQSMYQVSGQGQREEHARE